MKQRFLAGIAAAVLAFCPQLAGADALRVATDFSFEPFVFFDSKAGRFSGFEVDLIQLLASKTGHTVTFAAVPLVAVLQSVRNGTADIGAASISITPERKGMFVFSEPYYESGVGVLVAGGKERKIRSVADLRFHRVCAQSGTTGTEVAKSLRTTSLRLFSSIHEALVTFSGGGCDAVIGDWPMLAHYADQPDTPKQCEVLPEKLTSEPLGFVFSRKHPNLVHEFNRALAEARESGEYQALVDKWFPPRRAASARTVRDAGNK